MDAVGAVLAGAVMGIVLAGLIGGFLSRVVDLSGSVAFLLVGSLIYGSVALMTWVIILRRPNVSAGDVGFGEVRPGPIALMIPVTLGVLIMNFIVASLTAGLFGDVPTAEDQLGIGAGTITIVDFVCLLVVAAVLAPIVEELVFRGVLYRAIRSRIGVASATVITALAFSLTHFEPLLIGVFFAFGLVLAFVAERTDSLYPPIVLHALNNTVAIVLLYVSQ